VRWAGCALNSRKFVLDLTNGNDAKRSRWAVHPVHNARDLPLTFVPGLNHATILSNPSPELIRLVRAALRVEDDAAWHSWLEEAHTVSGSLLHDGGINSARPRAGDKRMAARPVQLFAERMP
jgi:hypothetical protein